LIEVLIASVVLSLTAAGVGALLTIALVSAQVARGQTFTSALAMAKLEQLRGLLWAFDMTGTPLADVTTDLTIDPPGIGGVGLTISPPDALQRNAIGYVDFLDESGRWVGTGAQPPRQAVYIRRWSVQPLGADPGHSLLLQVLVTSAARRASLADPRLIRLPGDALPVTVKTRKAA